MTRKRKEEGEDKVLLFHMNGTAVTHEHKTKQEAKVCPKARYFAGFEPSRNPAPEFVV